jgi:glycogen synthase
MSESALGAPSPAERSTPAARVALVSVGDPAAPETWSGVTAGVLGGLRELGLHPSSADVSLPVVIEPALLAAAAIRTRNRYDAEGAELTGRIRSLLACRRIGRAAFDGVIQIGTTFELPRGISYVTLEDMTLSQATVSHPVFSRMSAHGIACWERRRTRIYARAAVCAAASRWTAASLRDDYGIAPERVAVVGFGANNEASVPERDWSTPRFLFVGIDWDRKGGPQVLRAFSRVREVYPRATLEVVGGHPPLEQAGVRGHGVLSRAEESDRRTIATLFAQATCFVMPSSVEPFGIAYVEAGAAGIASIAGGVGGPADLIGADAGIMVDTNDERALAEAMLRMSDPEVAISMGRAARTRSRLYTWRKVAERLMRALGLGAPDGRRLAEYL